MPSSPSATTPQAETPIAEFRAVAPDDGRTLAAQFAVVSLADNQLGAMRKKERELHLVTGPLMSTPDCTAMIEVRVRDAAHNVSSETLDRLLARAGDQARRLCRAIAAVLAGAKAEADWHSGRCDVTRLALRSAHHADDLPTVDSPGVVTIGYDPCPVVASQRRGLNVVARAAKSEIALAIVISGQTYNLPSIPKQALAATYRQDRYVDLWTQIKGVLPSRRLADVAMDDGIQSVEYASDVGDTLVSAARDGSTLALRLAMRVAVNPCMPHTPQLLIVAATHIGAQLDAFSKD